MLLSNKQGAPVNITGESDFVPVRMLEVEIGQPLPDVSAFDEKTGRHYQRAWSLVRLHTRPLGLVELQLEERGVSAGEYAAHIWRTLSETINEHLRQDGLPAVAGLGEGGLLSPGEPQCVETLERFLANPPFVSVIVATRDRPSHLVKCLHSLLALQYPRYEIIVVDNAPSSTATVDLFQDICRDNPGVRYAREDRPGLSWARNCGIAAARGEILAFTDDDVVVDRYWLVELARGFSATAGVGCVTGLILPLELETQPQLWFEERCFPSRVQYDGYCLGFARRIFDMRKHKVNMPLHPYMAGRFGAGASMAFTKACLQNISSFDPALVSGGGEDHAAFFQVIARGYKLVYEPAAVVYHCHRRDYKGLYKQLYRFGTGFTAYLTRSLLVNPRLIPDFVVKLPYALFFVLSRKPVPNRAQSINYPKELDRAEIRGMLRGPLTYFQSLWALRGMHKVRQ
jgi:glycosyltransferase involved in cell wall biosynthesis